VDHRSLVTAEPGGRDLTGYLVPTADDDRLSDAKRANKTADRLGRRSGSLLIARMLNARRVWLCTGVLVGLVWTAARLAVPLLTAAAANHGILAPAQLGGGGGARTRPAMG